MENKKIISVFIESDSICNNFDNKKLSLFLNQLLVLKKNFSADIIILSFLISNNNIKKMKTVFKILADNLNNLSDIIKIDVNYYDKNNYAYTNDKIDANLLVFNTNKMNKFEESYLNNSDYINKLLIVIDEDIFNKIYKKYKNIFPVVQCYPTASKSKINKNNLIKNITCTKGLDGVIEVLNTYITNTKELNSEQILKIQSDILNYKDDLENVKLYLKKTKTIKRNELELLNQLLDCMYREAVENNDRKNSLRIENTKRNLNF